MLSGALGGAVVLLAGGALALGGVFDGADGADGAAPAGGSPAVAQASGTSGAKTVNEIYDRVGPGVVSIEAARGGAGDLTPVPRPEGPGGGTATGSGFVLDDEGYVLTNAHVVEGARSVQVGFAEGDEVTARIVGIDPSSDLALVKVNPDDAELTPLPLGDSGKVEVGDLAVAIGNPFGLERTVTTGIISALQRSITAPNRFSIGQVLQTDAAINPGNSGGPLLDGQGRVIGINTQIATDGSRANSGVGFAVPVNEAKRVVSELKADGRVERAFLGVSTGELTDEVVRRQELRDDDGAVVGEVTPGAPADRAGLRAGDVVVAVAGRPVSQPADVVAVVATKRPGDRIEIEFVRGGEREQVEVTLGTRPERARG
jgi:S1-C subfamily serine protease